MVSLWAWLHMDEMAYLDVIDTEPGLLALLPEWTALLSRGRPNGLMLGPDWQVSWWRVFGDLGRRRLCVGAVRDGRRLIGLAPLLRRTQRLHGILPLRRLEALGSGEPEEDEVLSEYLGLIAEVGAESRVAEALASAVAGGRFGGVDELVIPLADGESPSLAALGAAFRERGWRVAVTQTTEAPYVALPASWEEYLATLPSRRRKELRRTEADLEAWAGEPLRLHVAADQDGLAEGRAVLERLHADRWSTADRPGVFASSRFRRFHETLMPILLERGALELLWLTARDEPLAALYNIVWEGRVYQYQAGRRMDLGAPLRPGFAIHLHAIRRAIAHGRLEYDLMGGTAHYKREFALQSRPLVEFRTERPGARAMVRHTFERAAGFGRRLRRLGRATASSDAEHG